MGGDPGERQHGRFRRAVGTPILGNSEAFGFSITITVTFGMVSRAEGSARVPELFLFGIAAACAFVVVEAAVSRGFRVRVEPLPPEVRMMGTAFGVLSIAAAIGSAYGLVEVLGGLAAWSVPPFAASLAFVGMEVVEALVAAVIQEHRGDTGG